MRKQVSSGSLVGTLDDILNTRAQPVQKQPVRVIPLDDRAAACLLASEVMAQARLDASPWNGFAQRLIYGTVEFRAQFIAQISKEVKATASANECNGHFSQKESFGNIASAMTMVSAMRAIARGFNSGGSLAGLEDYARVTSGGAKDLGHSIITRYARKFGKSNAGRPAHDYLTKLTTWLNQNAPDENDLVGITLRDQVTKMCVTLKAAQVAAL
jgi:hypothetical protein